jgi:hypothetical protein
MYTLQQDFLHPHPENLSIPAFSSTKQMMGNGMVSIGG